MKKLLSAMLVLTMIIAVLSGCGAKIYTFTDRDAVSVSSDAMASTELTITEDIARKQVKFAYPAGMTVEEIGENTPQNQLFSAYDDETGSRVTLLGVQLAAGDNASTEAKAMLNSTSVQNIIDKAQADFTTLYGEKDDFAFGFIPAEKAVKYGNCLGVSFSYSVTAGGESITYYYVIINGNAPDKATDKATITYSDNIVYVFIFEAPGGDMSVFKGAENYMVVR